MSERTPHALGHMMNEQNNRQRSQMTISDWPEWRWFDTVVVLVRRTLAKAENTANSASSVFPFIDSVLDSAESLRMLAHHAKLRDSYVIGRVIYETSVNTCFLLTDPVVLVNRAVTHANQKTLRGLVREIELCGEQIFTYKMPGIEALMNDPANQKALYEYTSRSGREITSWTPENVQQRLEAIHSKFSAEKIRGLAFGLLLYRHSSEIAHGTLYGTLFSWGASEVGAPLKSSEDIGKFRHKELRLLLKLISYSLESLVSITGSALGIENIDSEAAQARLDYYRDRKDSGN